MRTVSRYHLKPFFFRAWGLGQQQQQGRLSSTDHPRSLPPHFVLFASCKGGSTTSEDTMMDGPDTGKSRIMLFFIGLCAPAEMGKQPTTHYYTNTCVKLTIVTHPSFSERIAIPNLSFKPPYAIVSVPSLSGQAIAYRWRPLPRVRRHRASKPGGSSKWVLPWQVTMGQLICASLSHTHYW